MGKIIIDTTNLTAGDYVIRKIGPKQFSLIANSPSHVELNESNDATYTMAAGTWISRIIVIPTLETQLNIKIAEGEDLISEILEGGRPSIFHIDIYANEANLTLLFQGINSSTKILLIN